MALPRFQYTGSWENPADFPTHEYSEAQVRRDIMRFFTEIQTYLNKYGSASLNNVVYASPAWLGTSLAGDMVNRHIQLTVTLDALNVWSKNIT